MTLPPVRLRVDIDGRMRLYSYIAQEWIYVDWKRTIASLSTDRTWIFSTVAW